MFDTSIICIEREEEKEKERERGREEELLRRVIQNICILNMLTFDVGSVFHSLCQSVTGIALFIFWIITQEYNFSQTIL